MQKSADAFRTISEVADDLSLPQHVLRFWETRFPQLRPLKRAGGRRYYRPADVSLLKAIRQLLYDDGYTIKGVQRLLKEQGAKGLSAGAPSLELDWEKRANVGSLPWIRGDELDPLGDESHDNRRAAIAEALAVVDECKRILDNLLAPSR